MFFFPQVQKFWHTQKKKNKTACEFFCVICFSFSFVFCWETVLSALGYLFLIRHCIKTIVYGSIVLILIGGAGFAWAIHNKKGPFKNLENDTINNVFTGVIAGFTFIFFCLIFCFRKRIQIAVEVIRSAARSMFACCLHITFFVLLRFFLLNFSLQKT